MNLCFHIIAFTDSQLQSQNHYDTTSSHEDDQKSPLLLLRKNSFIHQPQKWQDGSTLNQIT